MNVHIRSFWAFFLWAAFSASAAHADPAFDVLTAFSNAFRSISAKCEPSVVHLAVEGGSMSKEDVATYMRIYGDPFDFFGNAYLEQSLARVELPPGTGSGTVWRKDGHIVTCNHVVANRTKIVVTDSEQREFTATLVAADAATDIAVLKITALLQPATLGKSSILRQGDWVVTLGAPFGLTQTMTHGIVSAVSRMGIQGLSSRYQNFIQTDAAVHPGNSGGPLLNLQGEVVGIINAAAPASEAMTAGIGFAIPVETVEKVVNDLLETGRVERPWLGFIGKDLNREEMNTMQASDLGGVLIEALIQGEPAHQAGLEVGDVIIRIDKSRVRAVNEISNLIVGRPLNSEITVEYYRDGIRRDVTAKVTKWKSGEEAKELTLVKARKFGQLGCSLGQRKVDVTTFTTVPGGGRETQRKTMFTPAVAAVEEGSELQPGENIVRLNGKEIHSLANLGATLAALPKETETIEVTTETDGSKKRTLQLQLRNQSPDSR